jgi:hypothetical protein
MAHEQLALPSLVIGRADALRLQREMEALNDFLYQAGLRAGGEQTAKLPKTSRVLDEFVAINKLNMLLPESRKQALEFMDIIVEKAPVVHMSFAVEPSSAFRQKLVVWWRQNIHGYVLMDVGLQPNIAIGAVVRTANKQYDFSLRKHFSDHKDVLVKLLQAGKTA